jgi:hypothetical protein
MSDEVYFYGYLIKQTAFRGLPFAFRASTRTYSRLLASGLRQSEAFVPTFSCLHLSNPDSST